MTVIELRSSEGRLVFYYNLNKTLTQIQGPGNEVKSHHLGIRKTKIHIAKQRRRTRKNQEIFNSN